MNSDESIGKILDFLGALSLHQVFMIVLACTIFWVLPPIIIRKAKKRMGEKGVEVIEDYNSILPFPREIDAISKVLVSLCYAFGFVILALALGIK